MPEEDRYAKEFDRLEHLISQSIGATRGLSEQVHALSAEIKTVETNRIRDKELADKTASQLSELVLAVNNLNTTLATINGKAQGVSMTAKAFWAISGTIIMASILWLSATIVDLKTQVAVLQTMETK